MECMALALSPDLVTIIVLVMGAQWPVNGPSHHLDDGAITVTSDTACSATDMLHADPSAAPVHAIPGPGKWCH